ncbi:exodeoxyribonuclease V subunit beta [Aestuariirhabdus sp. LZHN29]|uniref:exodeoxyribonuclease V subunit beta n=1 Tax=Aestuariirhabdus sp. LZHN29 TaxID=3417462 RepID=UPI003CE8D2C2
MRGNTPTRPLDPRQLPLQGVQLIEASAGTGKTYTITLLYLRALLAVGRDQPLSCDQILVVTFTEAATSELRDRIRRRIVEARQVILSGQCEDAALQDILAASPLDDREKTGRLEQAARQMDEAAIYTIHGFCWRMLTRNAFESGVLFSSEFTMDERPLKALAVNDFWRHNFYPLDDELVSIVHGLWKTPQELLSDINNMISAHDTELVPKLEGADLLSLHSAHRERIEAFKAAWLQACEDIQSLIGASAVDKRSYSSRYLPTWLQGVSDWALSAELTLPKSLDRFSQQVLIEKTKEGGEPPRHKLFDSVDELLIEQPPYKALLRGQAIKFVREHLQRQKEHHALMMPDDLLSRFAEALSGERAQELAQRIRSLYPLALIDEFQDTDPLQYRIFSALYDFKRASDTGLLMIGDPKQAIYSFRGADIFTYMQARDSAAGAYSMGTNWRSTQAMVDGVNALFGFSQSPFIYDQQIAYERVKAAGKSDTAPLLVEGAVVSGLCIWQHPAGDTGVAAGDIRQTFARSTALEISRLLAQAYAGRAVIGDRALQPGDFAVLVRSRFEARIVREALAAQQIDAVFLSRDTVFATPVARDLFRVLIAVSEPTNERLFNAALATSLLNYSAAELDQLTRDEARWESMQQLFIDARARWQKQGVLPMLHQLMRELGIAESQVAKDEGERNLTDLLHLGELLQQASLEMEGEHGLLRWFVQQLAAEGEGTDDQQLRLESDRKLVKIVTIHSSKGLEYGVTFLPFVSCHKDRKSSHYHEAGHRYWDLSDSKSAQEKADKERLSEDLRLLYVALTRSIYACYMGVANQGSKSSSNLPDSAIGYLLNSAGQGSLAEDGLGRQLQRLQQYAQQEFGDNGLQLAPAPLEDCPPPQPPRTAAPVLAARTFSGKITRDWRIGSYSGLITYGAPAPVRAADLPGYDPELQHEQVQGASGPALPTEMSAFNFPRGAQAGTFLHSLFEEMEFDTADGGELHSMLASRLQREGYDSAWVEPLGDWLLKVLASPLPDHADRFSLSRVANNKKRVEMEFLLPVAGLDALELNGLLKRYGHLPVGAVPPLSFQRLKGMLKGFIDLVFEHEGRYFVLDYKSNHLGDQLQDYSLPALQQAMLEHRYDLQYVIYTLALHRYLKTRLVDYDYEQHMGGCYYLFLRGMADGSGEQGIYFDKPDGELIAALDALLETGDE